MCLVKVYLSQDENRELVCTNAASILSQNGHLVVTDFLGRSLKVSGKISEIDLNKNEVTIKT